MYHTFLGRYYLQTIKKIVKTERREFSLSDEEYLFPRGKILIDLSLLNKLIGDTQKHQPYSHTDTQTHVKF